MLKAQEEASAAAGAENDDGSDEEEAVNVCEVVLKSILEDEDNN